MLTAVTRRVSARFSDCQLEYLERAPIDVDRAMAQHASYEALLTGCGCRVVSLEPDPELPDSVFVEDAAVVVDEYAVMTRMASPTRQRESESIERVVAGFRALKRIEPPGTLEGGDVMNVGRTLYVGLSRRTNREGAEQLSSLLAPLGYRIITVDVTGCMHLKTACCSLGDGRVLANRNWFAWEALSDLEILDVPVEEPWAANVLRLGSTVICPAASPRTADLLVRTGYDVRTIDSSELMKAEAGLTCMSLIF